MPALELLSRVADGFRQILGHNLTGFYVHGSVAFGCFRWETGDLDFLAVVDEPPTSAQKEALIRLLLSLDGEAPQKGFEMSVVLRRCLFPFLHPTPFELHYSNAHRDHAQADPAAFSRDMHGVDADLAAHCTVLHRAGLTLYGPPIHEVIGPVPRESYVDSILADVQDAESDVRDHPVYVTLNLCRVLAFLQEDKVLSKQQGGQWGLARLPEKYHPLLQSALDAYEGAVLFATHDLAGEFAAHMLNMIRSAIHS